MRSGLLANTVFLGAFICLCPVATTYAVGISGVISADTVWTADEVIEVTGSVEVDSSADLTIEAGAVVKFHQYTRLIVEGGLIAHGSELQPIQFTTAVDSASHVYYRMWFGISAQKARQVSLQHCRLSWATSLISADRTSLSLIDCSFQNFSAWAVTAVNASDSSVDSLRMHRCTFEQTDPDLMASGTAVDVNRSMFIAASECRIKDCLWGMVFQGYRNETPTADIQLCEFVRCDTCCLNFAAGCG